jgi:hypothetical protein
MKLIQILMLSILLLSCASKVISRDPVYRETELRHSRFQLDGEIFDSQEYQVELKLAFVQSDLEAERAVANTPRNENFIFKFWAIKKKILKAKHSISWRSPSELNPSISYENYGQPKITEIEKRTLFELVSAHLKNSNEYIIGATRDYKGAVYISTRENNSDVSRQYTFAGHDKVWNFLGVGIIEE